MRSRKKKINLFGILKEKYDKMKNKNKIENNIFN
jgi:hypothetical protein